MDLFSFNFLEPEAADAKPSSTPPSVDAKPKRRAPAKAAKPVVPVEERMWSVTQLLRETRAALEAGFTKIWVQGEISNFKSHPSGHQYFTLKDAGAQVSCVLWRSQAATLTLKLRDGMEVQVCGDLTVYEARGQMQMTVRKVQQSGQGALQQRFEELKRKLAEEGLFDSARKISLPPYPETIAIVTAASGAALRDMLHVLERRAPWIHVLVYSVAVQGAGAHEQIAAAIRYLSQPQPGLPKIDVLVVGRGGGSLEDLWSFNEESVARALADCPLPTISAVGHEIDFTIADFVADLRAPTPSAAAELLAPDRLEIASTLARWSQTMQSRLRQTMEHWRKVLALMGKGPLDRWVERSLADHQQALDELQRSLQQSAQDQIQAQRGRLQELRFQLEQHSPAAELQRRVARTALLRELLEMRFHNRRKQMQDRLQHLKQLLNALSPDATMARGYSLTTDQHGLPVKSVRQLKKGDQLRTRLVDGEIKSVVS
jgi:exodeoxyribonuclease VII large subunit